MSTFETSKLRWSVRQTDSGEERILQQAFYHPGKGELEWVDIPEVACEEPTERAA